jgi:uncharacterized protein (DUF433 family)
MIGKRARIVQGGDEMDWSDCDVVEVVPGKVSGVPLIRNTRVPAADVWESAELGETAEEIAFNYDLSLEDVRAVLAHAARSHVPAPAR